MPDASMPLPDETATPLGWKTVEGVVVQGHRVASGQSEASPYPAGTIALQMPRFLERGLDLRACHPATLNVSIAPATFELVQPTHTFRQVRWTVAHPPEDFSFVRCQLSVALAVYEGWIYYPHPETKERHHQAPSVLELLMPFIPAVGYGTAVALAFPSSALTLSPT